MKYAHWWLNDDCDTTKLSSAATTQCKYDHRELKNSIVSRITLELFEHFNNYFIFDFCLELVVFSSVSYFDIISFKLEMNLLTCSFTPQSALPVLMFRLYLRSTLGIEWCPYGSFYFQIQNVDDFNCLTMIEPIILICMFHAHNYNRSPIPSRKPTSRYK